MKERVERERVVSERVVNKYVVTKYVVEFVGTFFLVFTVGMAAVYGGAGALAPVAISAVLIVLIYAGGHISGAHYNPAVTLGMWIRGVIPSADAGVYVAVQLAAAIVASFAVGYLHPGAGVTPIVHNVAASLVAEALCTFALVYVVLSVATAKATEGNAYFGLAIGFTVLAGAYAVGGISGGAFNPAVAVGITIMGASAWGSIWIYLVATLLGAAAAAAVFKARHPGE